MRPAAPRWLDNIEADDLGALQAMTPTERLSHFVEACNLARAILQHRPDAAEVLQRREPLSPEAEATWLRLCAEGRRARAA